MVNAADVQTINPEVLASVDGSEVSYAVGKLVPGTYKFKAQLTSKVYGVNVKIGNATALIAPDAVNASNVDVEFTLTQETDITLTLVSTDPGEAGAGWTVASPVVSLEFNFAAIKTTLANNADDLATTIGGYNYAAKQEDVDAANALKTKANGIEETYDDYKKFKLYAQKSTIQEEIDQLATSAADKEAAYQNEQAYSRVNTAITAIKGKYNAAVAELEGVLVGAAAYLLDQAKAELNGHINVPITEATAASYTSYQNGTAVADEATNMALIPTEITLNSIVNDWKNQATTNINKYNDLHAIVTDLQGQLDAITPVAAIASLFPKTAAQNAINEVDALVEAAKNSADQLTLDVTAKKNAAQNKITDLKNKVDNANGEYAANQSTLAAIELLQTNLNNAKEAVALKVSSNPEDYTASNYYADYVGTGNGGVQKDINDLSTAAAAAYKEDGTGTARTYNNNLNTTPVQDKIDAYKTNAVDAVTKYDDLQTAIANYETKISDARDAVKDLDIYTDPGYDYETKLNLIQKRVNDIKKAIAEAKKKKGSEHWTAMLAIDADVAILTDVDDLLSTAQSDQNQYDADQLAGGITTLDGKISTFEGKVTSDAVFGDDFGVFAGAENDIKTAFDAIKDAKNDVDNQLNSETVDYTSKVGTTTNEWVNAQNCPSGEFHTYTGNGVELIQVFGVTGIGDVLTQEVDVEDGIYDIEVYATSHNAWNGIYGINSPEAPTLQEDADDVAYVYAESSNKVTKFITARRNSGYVAEEPIAYPLEGVKVENGKLKIGLALAQVGKTEWHAIRVKSLKARTASLIENWTAKITDLNKQQTALETASNDVAAKVTANSNTKTTLGTNIGNLQTAMGTFATTYKIGQDDSVLGNRGKAGGSVTTEVGEINTALSTLAGNNSNVDVTAAVDVPKTDNVGKTKADWPSTLTYGEGENYAENNGTVESYKKTVEGTGIVLYQKVTGLPNGIYNVVLTANANFTPGRGFNSDLVDGATDAAYVFANDRKEGIVSHVNTGWTLQDIAINGVIVSDGTLRLGIGKYKAQTNWNAIQIKSLTYRENASADLPTYNEQYTVLAERKLTLDRNAPVIKAEVEANATTYTAANTAIGDLQTAELNTLKSLANVTDANAVSTDAVAKKTDPANFKVFETGLDADKSYTAKKTAIDNDIQAMQNAIDAAKLDETMVAKWQNNSITVVVGQDVQQQDILKTYSIAEITDAINALKTEAGNESANYLAYKELQDNNMSNLLPDNIFTKTVNAALVPMTDAEITELVGAGAKQHYLDLKDDYIDDKADILSRMQADLNARKAVSTKDAFVNEITALITKVNAVQGDAAANFVTYNEQKTAYTETQTLWNNTYTEIAATDKSTKVQDWLDKLDAIQVDLTAATQAVEANYPLGKSVAEAKDFAAIKARIEDVKAQQAESYNEFIAADNLAAHQAFMTAIADASTAYQNAVKDRAKYSSTNPDIEAAVTAAAAALDAILYSCPTDIQTLTANENAAYEAVVSPTVFDVSDFIAHYDLTDPNNPVLDGGARYIEKKIINALDAFKAAVKTAIQDDVWNPKKTGPNGYTAKVADAKTAIMGYDFDGKANAFSDVETLIALGDAGVESMTLSEVEAAINGLADIDALLLADKNNAADKDITKRINTADAKYNEVKGYINSVTNDIPAKAAQLAILEAAYNDGDATTTTDVAYAKSLTKTFANRDAAAAILDGFVTTATNCKTAVETAVTNDNNNTAAYEAMIVALGPVKTKLAEAKAAAAPYKYATSFATDEQALAGIEDDAASYKNAGSAVANKATVLANIATLSTNIEVTLTTAFGTEKTGLGADITELKNQYNAYVAAHGLDDTANAFKTAIDDLAAQLGACVIKPDQDDPADGQYDEILDATAELILLQKAIADKETELLDANASTANAEALADFTTQLNDLAAAATLEGNSEWVGQQTMGGKTIAEKIAEIQGQIADLQTAIAAEPNISFYKKQYQDQIDAVKAALDPVTQTIAAKQAQYDANAAAYATLMGQIAGLQTKVNAAKDKVAAYQYVGPGKSYDYTYYIEYDWDDDGEIDGGVQYSINWRINDIKTKNDAVQLDDSYDLTWLVDDVNNSVQSYLDKSAHAELVEQKLNLSNSLSNAIDNKYQAQKYSSALWNRLMTEKNGINNQISDLNYEIWNSYQIWETTPDYGYVLDDNDNKIAKPCTSDKDYADQMQTVAAIQALIADLSDAVDNLDLLGDANVDGRVNVLDSQKVLNMILDPTLQPAEDTDLFVNIDVNQSDVIEVGDLTAIVNYILYQDWQGYAAARGEKIEGESLSMTRETNRIAINLANVSNYTAFQLDLVLPEGMKMVGAELSNRAGESHKLYSRAQQDGSIRMVASSVTGEAFSGNEGAVLYINVEGTGTPELLNILFSDVNAVTRSFAIGDATGIDTMSTFEALKQKVYDLGGRVKNGLKKGINIIRRADGSTEKVVK